MNALRHGDLGQSEPDAEPAKARVEGIRVSCGEGSRSLSDSIDAISRRGQPAIVAPARGTEICRVRQGYSHNHLWVVGRAEYVGICGAATPRALTSRWTNEGKGLMTRAIVVVAGLMCSSALAQAQSIRGTVVDEATRAPIPGVLMTMVGADDRPLGVGVRTDSMGAFMVHAPRSGTWRVRTSRLGYAPTTSPAVELGIGALAVVRKLKGRR